MELNNQKYGILLHPEDLKLHRQYFKEMVKLNGIYVVYRAPRPDKHYTIYAEIDSNYCESKVVGCLFEEHPNQYTMKKLGWVSELQTDASLISVPYDLEGLQKGALFIIPSGIDNAQGRLFMVDELSNTMILPASITCRIVPVYADTYTTSQNTFTHSNFNLLNNEDKGNR